MRTLWKTLVLTALLASGCYHYTFAERTVAPSTPTVTYQRREPTYLNGFIGNGKVDTRQFCARPVRTELRVTAADVALGMATLLIYTPHTLYVTCEAPRPTL